LNQAPFQPKNNGHAPSAAAEPTAATDRRRLVERASRLVETASLHLGLATVQARLAGQTATLVAGDKTVAVLPMGATVADQLVLVISVQSDVLVCAEGGPADAVAVLQHAAGALYAFSASLGASPEGFWTVHRKVSVADDDAQALAGCLVETIQLTDFMLQYPADAGH